MTKGTKSAIDTRALYRKYRSKSLAEVVGQEHITNILERSLKKGKIAHAYLFTGPRGVGKTSIARILAHEINQLPYDEHTQHPDIIEIDAASNRRIDDIRDLREKVQIAPSSAKYKVYIIDEVHMLTGESFNAFLKTLEEPPAHVVFILATTDAHKLPVTITSRTQRFAFRTIVPRVAAAHLRTISDAEGILITDDALDLVVEHGDGSFRDSISLLDQLSSLSDADTTITTELIEQVLGLAERDQVHTLLSAYESGNQTHIIETLQSLEQNGVAATVTTQQLIRAARQKLTTSPKLTRLLGDLIEVLASPRPDIKLLTTLLGSGAHTQKTIATSVAVAPELRPLEKEASTKKPSDAHVRAAVSPKPQEPPKSPEPTSTPEPVAQPETTPAPEVKEAPKDTIIEPTETTDTDGPVTVFQKTGSAVEFDWAAYVAHMKVENLALSSILAKCKAESDGTTLTVYTSTAFWKKKLDDIKYQPILHEGLVAVGAGNLSIETVPTTMPPKDSQAAAIAAIMGGGEEVEI